MIEEKISRSGIRKISYHSVAFLKPVHVFYFSIDGERTGINFSVCRNGLT